MIACLKLLPVSIQSTFWGGNVNADHLPPLAPTQTLQTPLPCHMLAFITAWELGMWWMWTEDAESTCVGDVGSFQLLSQWFSPPPPNEAANASCNLHCMAIWSSGKMGWMGDTCSIGSPIGRGILAIEKSKMVINTTHQFE